jgi:CRISPR-associated endonuclease Cas1
MNSDDLLFGRVVRGVLTLSGNAPSIRVENGMLVVRDGPREWTGPGEAPPIEDRIETLQLPRSGCPVKDIVVTRPDGFITFAAIEWLHETGVSLVQLDWHGNVLLAKGPAGPDRPAMRRRQALTAGSATGLAIMREILRHKLTGEATVARLLGGEDAAALIERMGAEIAGADSGLHALASEAAAASAYFALWSDVTMCFARRDKIPSHWQVFGQRHPLRAAPDRRGLVAASRPRNAASAPGAMLNYLFGLAVSQMTIALAAAGLDPGIGIFHADRDGRVSLAYDAIEPVRPHIEAWLLCVLAECRFAKRDFYEESDGTIRLTRPLSSWLALSAPLWRQAADVVARWLSDVFETAARTGAAGLDDAAIEAAETGECPPAPATQRALQPRETGPMLPPLPAPLPALPAPGRPYKPALAHEVMPRACHECGRALMTSKRWPHTFARRKFCSGPCAATYRAETRRLIPIEIKGARAIAAAHASEGASRTRLVRSSASRLALERAQRVSTPEPDDTRTAMEPAQLIDSLQPRSTELRTTDVGWTPADAALYSKLAARRPELRDLWAEVANAALDRGDSEASAIRQANAAVRRERDRVRHIDKRKADADALGLGKRE